MNSMINKYGYSMLHFLIAILTIVIIHSCISTKSIPIARVPTKITSLPLVDMKGIKHKYVDNFDSFIFPTHMKEITQYCSFHHDWEIIKAIYLNDEWSYFVGKHPKSFK